MRKERKQIPLLPENKSAIFWDYENFPLPKNVPPEIFFNTLFPSFYKELIITRKVYGSTQRITPSILQILEKFGFEYVKGIATGKASATDFVMVSDCVEFCTKQDPPLIVLIISGDADFLPLVQKLATQGHEVRLICQNKQKLSPKLHRIIPVIADRKDILKGTQQLMNSLTSLSQITNFILATNSEQDFSITDIAQELEDQTRVQRIDTLASRIELLLEIKKYNWQYQQSTDGKIKLASSVTLPDVKAGQNQSDTQSLILTKLGFTPDSEEWEIVWQEFQRLYPNLRDQEGLIKKVYKTGNIPVIRNRIQQKLISLVLEQENEEKIDHILSLIREDEKTYKCSVCQKEFHSEQALNQHWKDLHKADQPKPVECNVCHKSFPNQQALGQHSTAKHKMQPKTKKYHCQSCIKDFKTDLALLQHNKSKHGQKLSNTKSYKCNSCDKKFQTLVGLEQHKKKKH